MTDYQRVGSFECSSTAAVGVAAGRIAVAGDSRVTLVTADDRLEFDHDEPVTDVAVGDRVLVLSRSQLTAYDRTGARIWNLTAPDAHAVAIHPDSGDIGVLGPDTLRIVDPDTGGETVATDREPSGRPDDDRLLGTDAGFVTATWSVLQCFGLDGEVLFDENLDAAIRDMGYCDGVLVVALQDGTLRGFDAETGAPRWQTELPVRQLADRGQGTLLLRSDDGVKAVSSDGALDSAGSVSTGDIHAGSDGSLVCSVREGTVIKQVPADELLDIEVLTESVGAGGAIEIEARNRTDTAEQLTVTGALSHGDLAPSDRRLKIAAGESSVADFPVESVRTDGSAEFTVTVGDRVVARRDVGISDAAQSTVSAEASLEPVAVTDDAVEVELAVENTGGVTLDAVSELSGGERVTELGPGETWTATLTKPFEPDQRLTVGLEVLRANRRTELAPTCQLPARPSIDLEQRRDALHARIEADESVTWNDELVIETPGAGRVRSPIEITDGDLLVVLPVYESGVARVGLSRLGVSERSRTSDGPLADLGSRETRTDSPASATERSPERRSSQSDAATDDESVGSESNTDRPAATETDDGGRATTPSASSEDTAECRLDRQLSAASAAVGHAVRERLTITNEGAAPVAPRLRLGDEAREIGELQAGESVTLVRRLACLSPDGGPLSVPAAELVVDGTTVDDLPTASVESDADGVGVRGVVDPDSGEYEVELTNRTDGTARLSGFEVAGEELVSDGLALSAGESEQLSGSLGSLPAAGRDVVIGTMTTADSGTASVVLVVSPLDDGGDAAGSLATAIGSATKVAGDYGTVVLVVENETERPLRDITVRADGEMINDILYSKAHRDELAPGDRIEHYVDLKTTAGTVDIEFTASFEAGDASQTRTFSASGPAVNTESEWTDEHREAWTLTDTTTATDNTGAVPSTVATDYSRSE
ncbi:COG1361 family protein [Haloarcula sediminis]|uniref:PQQ-binding-like beta-propeller repeat protein n=1 Tax=Haloarcula sediminis TaxID=3111777 RepID=UPI002D78AF2E|nr:PQQ-binding-like beta-propeller repeat protein [Haloarcula sp. CK38]